MRLIKGRSFYKEPCFIITSNRTLTNSNRTLTNEELAMLTALRIGDKNYGVGNWC